jgi:hypothetical protein
VNAVMWRFIAVFTKAHHIQGGKFGQRKRPPYVAPNTLNKQSRTVGKARGSPSAWGLGRKLTTPGRKAYSSMGEKIYVYKIWV